jgi:hypothetical protein
MSRIRASKASQNRWRGKVLCPICGSDLTIVPFHIDHIHPRSRGGSDDPSNLQLLCATCNLHKHAKLMKDWAPWLLDENGNVLTWNELQTPAEQRAPKVKVEREPIGEIGAGDVVRVTTGRRIGTIGTVKHRYKLMVKLVVEGEAKILHVQADHLRLYP